MEWEKIKLRYKSLSNKEFISLDDENEVKEIIAIVKKEFPNYSEKRIKCAIDQCHRHFISKSPKDEFWKFLRMYLR